MTFRTITFRTIAHGSTEQGSVLQPAVLRSGRRRGWYSGCNSAAHPETSGVERLCSAPSPFCFSFPLRGMKTVHCRLRCAPWSTRSGISSNHYSRFLPWGEAGSQSMRGTRHRCCTLTLGSTPAGASAQCFPPRAETTPPPRARGSRCPSPRARTYVYIYIYAPSSVSEGRPGSSS